MRRFECRWGPVVCTIHAVVVAEVGQTGSWIKGSNRRKIKYKKKKINKYIECTQDIYNKSLNLLHGIGWRSGAIASRMRTLGPWSGRHLLPSWRDYWKWWLKSLVYYVLYSIFSMNSPVIIPILIFKHTPTRIYTHEFNGICLNKDQFTLIESDLILISLEKRIYIKIFFSVSLFIYLLFYFSRKWW